jgi:hypothetical protein
MNRKVVKRTQPTRPKKFIQAPPEENNPNPNPIILTMDGLVARANNQPPPKEVLKIANIPLGGKKRKISETEQFEKLIKTKPPMKKVRKFFNAYADRNTKEECEKGPEYKSMLTI